MSIIDSERQEGYDRAVEHACKLLRQILRLYKEIGPQSMKNLASSYLAEPPTSDSAQDPAEAMMAEAFKIFDEATDSVLRVFAAHLGFDLSDAPAFQQRRDEGYFWVMYPVLVMYTIWMDQEGEETALTNLQDIFSSMTFGTAGYVMLDSNLDEGKEDPAEILLSLAYIQEHERLLLDAFGFDAADYELLNRFKQLYLKAEMKEKRLRFVRSPYTKDRPEDCGYKAVHAYLPFGILLRRNGKEGQIDGYLQFLYEWGAPLQIMDDLIDLEDDLKAGHYSYPTIGFEAELATQLPSEVAKLIKSDREHIERLYQVSKTLIENARDKAVALGADLMGYFVSILDSRLDAFYSETLTALEKDSTS